MAGMGVRYSSTTEQLPSAGPGSIPYNNTRKKKEENGMLPFLGLDMDKDFLLWTPALSGQENHIHRGYTGVGKGFVVISGILIGSCTENSQ